MDSDLTVLPQAEADITERPSGRLTLEFLVRSRDAPVPGLGSAS